MASEPMTAPTRRSAYASKAIAAVLAVGVVGTGGWFAYQNWGGGEPAVDATEQIVPVQRGDLVNSISVNGSLTFPDRETLTFSNAGTVAVLSAQAGQRVQSGQELARLDSATIATLERAVSQARVDVQDAEEALDGVRTIDPVKLAQARTAAANAGKALEQLTEPSALSLAQAEAAVASARLALQKAEDARQDYLGSLDRTELESAVKTAETALANSRDSLAITRSSWDSKLSGVRTTRDDAASAYRKAFTSYLGVQLTDAMLDMSPSAIVDNLKVDLKSLYARPSDRAIADGLVPANNPATPWDESTIFMWAAFYPGQIIVSCETGVLPLGSICVTRELDNAHSAYEAARDSVLFQENQAAVAIASAELAVDKAEAAGDQAATALARAEADAGKVELAVRDQDIVVARAKLDDALEALDSLKSPDPLQVALKKAELDAATASLESLEAGDPLLVALRDSALATANAALESALARLEGAVLKAPWDGEIAAVNIGVGDPVNTNTTAIEIVNPSRVQLSGSLDEIDVLFVQEGIPVRVTMDALAGNVAQGTVAEISSQGVTQSGVVTFPVTIDVTAPQGVTLREGLSATATIVLNQESNVLLIPYQAVGGNVAQPVVRVLEGNAVQERPVALGTTDGFWVAVTDGLAEGDRIVMEGSQTTASQANLRGAGALGGLGGPTFFAPGGGRTGPRQQFFEQQGGQRQGQQGQQGGRQGGQQSGGQAGGTR